MKYKCVRIDPEIGNESLKVTILEETIDRIKINTLPNDVGFYWFPETISEDVALERLKNHLIQNIKDQITRLEKEMRDISEIKL